jgi:hypothetical protein
MQPMSWHEHHLAHSTNRNTRRTADTNDDILDIQRRGQLGAQGLIDFNAPAAVVRAVERRLAVERGEPVRQCRSVEGVARFIAYAVGTLLLGVLLCLIPPVAPVGVLAVLGGAVVLAYGTAERTVSLSFESDQKALATYEAQRHRQIES